MFVTANQIYVFFACLFFGVISGIVYGGILLITVVFPKKAVSYALNVIFFAVSSYVFTLYANFNYFPNFRLYMAIGVIVGMVLYVKSFHKVIAIYFDKVYNKVYNKYKIKRDEKLKLRIAARKKRNGRTKIKKSNIGSNFGGVYVTVYSHGDNSLSTGRNSKPQK